VIVLRKVLAFMPATDNVSQSNSDRLPSGCQLRAARSTEQWSIQHLLWGLIKSEGLNFEARLFGYYLLQALLLGWGATFLHQFLDRFTGVIAGLLMIVIVLLVAIALLLLFFVGVGITFIFIGGISNWPKYLVVECNHSLVACIAARQFHTHTIIYNLFVKPSWRDQGIGSALVRQVRRSLSPIVPKPNHRSSQILPNPNQDIYLVCKPRLVGFYTRLGFVSVPWSKLPDRVKTTLSSYKPHPRLWGLSIAFMRWREPVVSNSPKSLNRQG
jgi:GNAT superfamily N-acetyltransferase